MEKKIIIGLLVVVAAALAILFIGGNGGDEINGDQDILGEEVTHSDVRVETPEAGDTLSRSFVLRGEARGTWYFEANFSARVESNDGRVLAEVPVQADGEWMTENFVSFEREISWTGEADAGFVILEKANPSGLSENAAEVRIPVRFSAESEETQTVSVYYSSQSFGAEPVECDVVVEITRTIPQTQSVARAAIEELLAGPTAQEAQGDRVVTNIPDGVRLNSIRIDDGTAFVDFSEELNQVGGSCRVTAIRAQIENTLMQFSTVDDVVISVEGNVEEALQP
ncbi:MAG: GerMN domain-containing protein [Candidatus Paceibacterota bacterium]